MRKNIVYNPNQGKAKQSSIALRIFLFNLIIIVIIAIIVVWNYKSDKKSAELVSEIEETNKKALAEGVKSAIEGCKLLDEGEWESARSRIELARESGAETVDYYLAAGRLSIHDQRFLKAADLLEKAVDKGANKPEYWVLLVSSLEWAGENYRKVSVLSQAIERTKKLPSDMIWMAGQFRQLEMYEQALQVYSVASGKPSVALEADLQAVRCCLKLRKLNRAEKFIQRARRLDTGNPEILELMEQLQEMMKKEN